MNMLVDICEPTRLVTIPVGVGHVIPSEPVEGAGAALVMEPDPEGTRRATEHQAICKGLLEPLKMCRGF